MAEPDYVVAGTGSRRLQTAPDGVKRAAADRLSDRLAEVEEAVGGRLVVMSGCAEGWDACVARTAIRAGLRLWCAVPTRTYGRHYWGDRSVTGRNRLAEFEAILASAWRITYVMEEALGVPVVHVNDRRSNFARNTWMVGKADEFVVWDPSSRGTAHCLAEIRRAGNLYRVLSEPAEALPRV